MDEEVFAQIAATLAQREKLEWFQFNAYETTPAIADSLVSIITNNQSVQGLALSMTSTQDATDALRVAKALGQSHASWVILDRFGDKVNRATVMDPQVAQAFAQSAIENTNLQEISFVDYLIDETAATLFAEAITQRAPNSVYLGHNGLTDDTFALLQPALENNSNLVWLGVVLQQLTDVSPLITFYNNFNLSSFWISYASQNPIDSTSLTTLTTKLATDSQLGSLGLDGLGIDDQGMQQLAQAVVQNSVLQQISLEDNNYTVAGARSIMNTLETNQSLVWCDLDKNVLMEIPEEEMSVFWHRLFENGNRG
jgi:hypothetical protein